MHQELIEKLEDGVLTLTLNRPEYRNALTMALTDALLKALRRATVDGAVRAVVLTGAGRAFCAGGDVKAMAEDEASLQTPEELTQLLREQMECSRLLHEMPKPTIAVRRSTLKCSIPRPVM